MRYTNQGDAQWLRRRAMGPILASARRNIPMPLPGRGEYGSPGRVSLRGFGAASTASDVTTGAGAGAKVGSAILPGAGSAIGAAVGAIIGLAYASLNRQDQEVGNFDQAVALWQQNRTSVLNIADKYLVLAGLFDLNIHTNIPIYLKYGRMGEQRFVTDMANLIYNAAQSGQITATDTPLTIMSKVVQPWIDGFGYGQMNDPHADMINLILLGMVADYVTGNYTSWRARSGDFPFGNLPAFALPVQQTASPTPSPQVSVPSIAPVTSSTVTGSNQITGSAPTAPVTVQPVQSAASQTPFPGFPNVTVTDPRFVGVPWNETENGYANTWSPLAPGYFTTTWPGNVTSKLFFYLQGNNVVGFRQDANGAWGQYSGTIASDGVTITGTAYWYNTQPGSSPVSYPWQALIQGSSQMVSPTSTSGAATNVSNTPPAIGTVIAYAKDDTSGQMFSIPAGGTYAGLGTGGGWLITYAASTSTVPAGTYRLSNGQMVQAVAATVSSGSTGTTTTSVSSGGGGFNPYYSSDTGSTSSSATSSGTVVPQTASMASGISPTLLMVLAGVGVVFALARPAGKKR